MTPARRSIPLLLMLTIGVLLLAGSVGAQGYRPEEAARHMQVAEGLEVELVASEPLVRQPVAIEYDDRGRLWVIQYLQYPNPAELKRAKVDRYSRTTYDRVPDPPPRGPKGNDRITILEDTDGDGRTDRAKDFLSDLNLASGLAFGHGGVFVLQVPYLLFYPDRDRDDVPDDEPRVLLSGFGMEDAHSVANSLTWGPDGWLYGCQGSTVTSHIRGIEFQQGVWRYHPLTHRFELFCEGGGNSWGLDFDEHGNLFYSTNFGGYALLHGVQGAYYWKQFGKHGALHNPHAYGYFDHVPHANLKGGHVTVGGTVYQGTSLGAGFRGKYLTGDLLGHAMYAHELLPRGSTFSARWELDLLQANDNWFAPSDLTVAADGSVLVCDWHDQRTAHPDPDAEWDRSNGRIYRLRAKGQPRVATQDLSALASSQLVSLLGDTNDWYVRRARRLLADRRDPEMIFPLRTLALTTKDDHLALEALWALYVSGGFSDAVAAQLLAHRSADVRWWTVRLLGDDERVSPVPAAQLAALAASDPSIAVRCQLACTAKRLPAAEALPILAQLVRHDGDAADPYLPLLAWWAVERHCATARDETLALFCEPGIWQYTLARETILPRLMRRYAAEASAAGYQACARLLAAAPAERAVLFAALNQGLADRASVRGGAAGTLYAELAVVGGANSQRQQQAAIALPEELQRAIDAAWRDDPANTTLLRLSARLSRPAAIEHALSIARDGRSSAEARREAIGILAESGAPQVAGELAGLLTDSAAPPVALAVLEALPRFGDEATGALLLHYRVTAPPALRDKATEALLSRKAWTEQLLAAVDRGELAARDISVDQLRAVSLHHDAGLDALVKKHWGSVQGGTPEERLAEMRRINNDLRSGEGNLAAGKLLFGKHCGTCHRLFDEGTPLGPELTHANRKKLDELLATIVNPSAVIRKEYLSYLVETTDGRVLSGLIVEQSPGSVTLLGAKNERTKIARDQIASINESPQSLMPDNLLSQLKPQELRDLFRYLQSDAPAAAP